MIANVQVRMAQPSCRGGWVMGIALLITRPSLAKMEDKSSTASTASLWVPDSLFSSVRVGKNSPVRSG